MVLHSSLGRAAGSLLCWDITVICPLAESYISGADCETGAVAELAASHEDIEGRYIFEPIEIETAGVLSTSAHVSA